MAILFEIQAWSAKEILLHPNPQNSPEELALLYERVGEFPEKKWVNRDGNRGWVLPLTKLTFEHIRKYWTEKKDFKIWPQAKLMMTKELLEAIIHTSRAEKRWQYLFEGKTSDFIIPCEGKLTPYDHQRVTVESAVGMEYFGLLMEMGTGKTKCIAWEMDFYLRELNDNETFHAVVICPKSLRETWIRELKSVLGSCHHYTIQRLDSSVNGMAGILQLVQSNARIRIGVCSYDSVRSLHQALLLFTPDYLVCDESHYVKSPSTKRFEYIMKFAPMCKRRRILTGTPVSNKIVDLWSQFEILRPGALGVNSFAAFKRMYAKVEEYGGFENIVGYQNIDQLKEAMAAISFVVKKDQCLDLPDQVFDTRYIDMPPELRKIYDEFETSFSALINEAGDVVSTEVLIAQLTKLSQMCSGFAMVPKIENKEFAISGKTLFEIAETVERKEVALPGGDEKLKCLIEDVEDMVIYNKVIIWARFHRDIDIIRMELNMRNIPTVHIDGRVKEEDRTKYVDSFNNDPKVRCIVMQPAAGGVGLTLLGNPESERDYCATAIFYSNGLSFGQREQAEARNHRIGQRHKVTYLDYVYKNTIDERIATLLQAKRDLAGEIKDVGAIKDLLLGKK